MIRLLRILFPGSIYDNGINLYSDADDILPNITENSNAAPVTANAGSSAAAKAILPKYSYSVKLADGSTILVQSQYELTKDQVLKIVNIKKKTHVGKAAIFVRDSQNPHVQGFLKTFKLTDYVKSRMADLGDSLELVNDSTIKQYVEDKLDNCVQTKKVSIKDMEEMEMLVDVANEFSGEYAHFRNIRMNGELKDFSNISKFSKYLKNTENISPDDLLNKEALPAQFAIRMGSSALKSDLKKETMFYSMRQYMKNYPDNDMANYLYEKYLKLYSKNPAAVEKMKYLNQNYNVKVFLPTSYNKQQCDQVLDYIDKEFKQWKKASDGTAKLPPVIDFSAVKTDWYDTSVAYGQGAAEAYSEPLYKGSLAFSSLDVGTVSYSLRHEMTHTNDLKHGENIPEKYNLDEIMPKKAKNINGRTLMVPDIENCKFIDEFRNAGIPERQIVYAYNNPKEFIAQAAVGDMSKYSSEFKEVLIDFGMPEWMFNMEKI